MTQSSISIKREQMLGFLLENIVAREVDRLGNVIIARGFSGDQFYIQTLSTQEEFPVEFEENPEMFDNDVRRLSAIKEALVRRIVELNREGYVLGFMLLRAEADYELLKNRTEAHVNQGHFLKQDLPKKGVKPPNSQKTLDPLEMVLWQIYKHTDENRFKRIWIRQRQKLYIPELYYFNSKEDQLEVVCFSDVDDPYKYKKQYCPICENPNEAEYSHRSCRDDPRYLKYVLGRDRARYTKRIIISRRRRSKDSSSKIIAEHGIRFKATTVGDNKLLVPERPKLAVVRS